MSETLIVLGPVEKDRSVRSDAELDLIELAEKIVELLEKFNTHLTVITGEEVT